MRVKLVAYWAFSGAQLLGNEKSKIYSFGDFIKCFVGKRRFIMRIEVYVAHRIHLFAKIIICSYPFTAKLKLTFLQSNSIELFTS